MIIKPASLDALFTGYKAEFQKALSDTPTTWQDIATKTTSTTSQELYAWFSQMPQFREWNGDRVLKDIAANGYTIVNKKFEASVTVGRDSIEDDTYGVFTPLFAEMGRAAKMHPEELVYAAIASGESNLCYDGQNYFDAEHPVYPNADGTGTPELVSNITTGTEPRWYLLDTSRALKPIILQIRRNYDLRAVTDANSENVVMRDEFIYGVDARLNAGYGFWQMAQCSATELNEENYAAARQAIMERKADGGRPMNLRPQTLLVPPALEGKARALIEKDENSGNPWFKSAKIVVSPWIS